MDGRIKMNENKSEHINFTKINKESIPVIFNNVPISIMNSVSYLGRNSDIKLKYKEHIKKKLGKLQLKYRQNVLIISLWMYQKD